MNSKELKDVANALADYLGVLSIPLERPEGLPHLHELDIQRKNKWETTYGIYNKICREHDKAIDKERTI
tara:strand:+ start:365 stop:571 length:207 start_codon:yes stop_codon:yes gene_type:complete